MITFFNSFVLDKITSKTLKFHWSKNYTNIKIIVNALDNIKTLSFLQLGFHRTLFLLSNVSVTISLKQI